MNLRKRIIKLEAGRSDQTNDTFYEIACKFAEIQGKNPPKKQDDIVLTLKQLGEFLPI